MRQKANGIERFDGDVKGFAARAMVATHQGMLPHLRFIFKTEHAEFVVEMQLEEAGKFLQQGLDAFDAALPRTPRPRRNSIYDQ
jgi:hypothetical protein